MRVSGWRSTLRRARADGDALCCLPLHHGIRQRPLRPLSHPRQPPLRCRRRRPRRADRVRLPRRHPRRLRARGPARLRAGLRSRRRRRHRRHADDPLRGGGPRARRPCGSAAPPVRAAPHPAPGPPALAAHARRCVAAPELRRRPAGGLARRRARAPQSARARKHLRRGPPRRAHGAQGAPAQHEQGVRRHHACGAGRPRPRRRRPVPPRLRGRRPDPRPPDGPARSGLPRAAGPRPGLGRTAPRGLRRRTGGAAPLARLRRDGTCRGAGARPRRRQLAPAPGDRRDARRCVGRRGGARDRPLPARSPRRRSRARCSSP